MVNTEEREVTREARPILAVIFDLDGTLLDTLEDLADSVNAMLAGRGLPTHPVDAYRYFVGEGASVLISRVLPEAHRDDATQAACLTRFREEYGVRWNVKTHPYEGVAAMLEGVRTRGVRMAVLSNKPHEATEQCVRALLPGIRFEAVLGQTADFPRKPDPAGALEIARRLEVRPADVLYLGDTATDMQTATAAGMSPVGALWGFRQAEELLFGGARSLISRPEEIFALIDAGRTD